MDKALESFLEDVGSAVAIGLVPFLGQAIDIYDTAMAAYDLYEAKDLSLEHKEEAYFGMALAAIGWIPGPGDGIKKTLKTINKKPQEYAPLLLDAVRFGLYKAGYKVDPHQFLMEAIDHGAIHKMIVGAKSDILHSSIYRRMPLLLQEGVVIGMELAEQSIPLVVGVIERKVMGWLHLVPKNTADTKLHQSKDKALKIPTHHLGVNKEKVATNGKPNWVKVVNGAVNASEFAMANLNQKQESIGEHVADYFCLEHFGHAAAGLHDVGKRTPAKLTDEGGKLTRLQVEVTVRGVGIDAIWKPGTSKAYGVTEYKARNIRLSEMTMRKLLVAESAQDANNKQAHRQRQAAYKKAKKNSAKTGESLALSKPELPRTVPKMSHKWIQDRTKGNRSLNDVDKVGLSNINKYSRHVIQVVTSVGDGKIHSDELKTAIEKKCHIDANKHPNHHAGIDNFINVFTEVPPASQTTPQTQQPTGSGRRST